MNLTNLYFETLLKEEKFKNPQKKMKMFDFESISSPLKIKLFVLCKTCFFELIQKLLLLLFLRN